MAATPRRQRFIPFRKRDIIELLLADGRLAPAEKRSFRELARILESLFHFEYHRKLEALKESYAPFNPDADTREIHTYSREDKGRCQRALVDGMTAVLQAANFEKVTETDLREALREKSLFKIRLEVDFDDFEEVIFYRRGARRRQETLVSLLGLRKRPVAFTNYDRVAIYVKFKESLLAYYFLAVAEGGMTRAGLDGAVEEWLAERHDCRIDFEIDDALGKLERLGLVKQEDGQLRGLPLAAAKVQLDGIWDDFFSFPLPGAGGTAGSGES